MDVAAASRAREAGVELNERQRRARAYDHRAMGVRANRAGSDDPVGALLAAVGLDASSYRNFVAWCLAEQLVSVMAGVLAADADHGEQPLWNRPDGGRRFRRLLKNRTGRSWSDEDEACLFERVRLALQDHHRRPIDTGDLLRLLWNEPHVCKRCGRTPPNVALHVDHIFPASKGGSSRFVNLQFLCAECNLKKSNRLEPQGLWLNSV